jgi:hypothetical protein
MAGVSTTTLHNTTRNAPFLKPKPFVPNIIVVTRLRLGVLCIAMRFNQQMHQLDAYQDSKQLSEVIVI